MRECLEIVSSLDAKAGGVSASLPPLARAISAEGIYTETILVVHGPGAQEGNAAVDGVAVVSLPVRRTELLYDGPASARLGELIAQAALVHIHGIWEPHCAISARHARRLQRPYVVSVHGMLERWALRNKCWKKWPYSFLIERRNLRRAACLRAVTRAEVEDYRRFGLRVPVAVIPYGVDVRVGVSPDIFYERFPELKGRRLVLFLGRIHYKKGLDLLCPAWAKVRERFPETHLVLAGPDFENTRASVENLVAELGIRDRVTLTGMLARDAKWSALAAAELFVLPSRSEGLPVAVLEAMAVGKPVIITRQCNLPEVDERQCGVVIEPDARQLEAALQQLLSMPSGEAIRMGDNGKRLVGERYNWMAVGRQMAKLYDRILGGPQPEELQIH